MNKDEIVAKLRVIPGVMRYYELGKLIDDLVQERSDAAHYIEGQAKIIDMLQSKLEKAERPIRRR